MATGRAPIAQLHLAASSCWRDDLALALALEIGGEIGSEIAHAVWLRIRCGPPIRTQWRPAAAAAAAAARRRRAHVATPLCARKARERRCERIGGEARRCATHAAQPSGAGLGAMVVVVGLISAHGASALAALGGAVRAEAGGEEEEEEGGEGGEDDRGEGGKDGLLELARSEEGTCATC
jgi:hypothetical protein